MYDVRIFFEKVDRAKYISHLDLYRCFIRCIKRSGISVWYTEGFNQHMYLTFALPLSLGVEGRREVLDLRFEEEIDFDEAKKRINDVLPMGIRVIKIASPIHKVSAVSAAKYHVDFLTDDENRFSGLLCEFLEKDSIVVEKKSKKKGMVSVEIRPYFDKICKTEVKKGCVSFDIILPAGGTLNINPQLLIDAFSSYYIGNDFETTISRDETYDENGNIFE